MSILRFLNLTAIVLILFITIPTAYADITRSGTCSTFSGSGTSVTKSHNNTASDNGILVVRVTHNDEVNDRVSAVTFNGDSLKRVKRVAGAFDAEYMYYMHTPDVGTYNLSVTFSNSGSFNGTICQYNGVDPTTPLLYSKTHASYPSTSLTQTLNGTSSAWMIGTAHNNYGAFTATTNTSIVNGTSHIIFDSNAEMAVGSSTYTLTKPSGSDGAAVFALFKVYESTPPVEISMCVYANIHNMNQAIGQTCTTDGATTTCTYDLSTSTDPIHVTSHDLLLALGVIIFIATIVFAGFMFTPFKKSL